MALDFRLANSSKNERQILQMDAVCFPLDAPPTIAGAEWYIGWDGSRPDSRRRVEDQTRF